MLNITWGSWVQVKMTTMEMSMRFVRRWRVRADAWIFKIFQKSEFEYWTWEAVSPLLLEDVLPFVAGVLFTEVMDILPLTLSVGEFRFVPRVSFSWAIRMRTPCKLLWFCLWERRFQDFVKNSSFCYIVYIFKINGCCVRVVFGLWNQKA